MNKKELKKELVVNILETVVQNPYCYVNVRVEYNGTIYWGRGFAKWNTKDMAAVQEAERILKHLDPECCAFCEAMADFSDRIINRFGWSEERGIQIATGRAIKDVVNQILTGVGIITKTGKTPESLVLDFLTDQITVNLEKDRLEKIMNAKVKNE